MPFFKRPTDPRVSGFDVSCNDRLAKAVIQKYGDRGIKAYKGPIWFARLRKRWTVQQIDEVLRWYVLNLGMPFIPTAYSARGFCEKFIKILDAKQRGNTTPFQAQLKISDHAYSVMYDCGELDWGAQQPNELPVIQQSLDAFYCFYDQLTAAAMVARNADEIIAFQNAIPDDEIHVREWMLKLHWCFQHDPALQLRRHVWHSGHAMWQKTARSLAAQFDCDPTAWDRIRKTIEKISKKKNKSSVAP